MLPEDDLDGNLGTLDVVAMDEVRSAFRGLDGLIEAAGFRNPADPRVVHVYFEDGIGDATDCRFDIRGIGGATTASTTPTRPIGTSVGTSIRKRGHRTGISIRHRTHRRILSSRPVSPQNSLQLSRERCTSYGACLRYRKHRTAQFA